MKVTYNFKNAYKETGALSRLGVMRKSDSGLLAIPRGDVFNVLSFAFNLECRLWRDLSYYTYMEIMGQIARLWEKGDEEKCIYLVHYYSKSFDCNPVLLKNELVFPPASLRYLL